MNSSSFSTVNPATGEQIETFPFFTAGETEAVLARAEKSFRSYRKQSVHQRAQLLSNLATILRKNKCSATANPKPQGHANAYPSVWHRMGHRND
jgi:acyl-CoA reductase-like NAD-dependent aldehyde dehydrogenase